MPRPKQTSRPVITEPAPLYTESAVRKLMESGVEPAAATYFAWVDYRNECAAYCERTGQPDPAEDVSGATMARMYRAVIE